MMQKNRNKSESERERDDRIEREFNKFVSVCALTIQSLGSRERQGVCVGVCVCACTYIVQSFNVAINTKCYAYARFVGILFLFIFFSF